MYNCSSQDFIRLTTCNSKKLCYVWFSFSFVSQTGLMRRCAAAQPHNGIIVSLWLWNVCWFFAALSFHTNCHTNLYWKKLGAKPIHMHLHVRNIRLAWQACSTCMHYSPHFKNHYILKKLAHAYIITTYFQVNRAVHLQPPGLAVSIASRTNPTM